MIRKISSWPGLLAESIIRPRLAGRRLAGWGVPSALLAHLFGVAGLMAVVFAVQVADAYLRPRVYGAGAGMDIWLGFFKSLVYTPPVRLAGAGRWIGLAMTAGLFEAYYWTLGMVVASGWLGLDLPPRRHMGRAAVVTGYASVWLAPFAAAWGLAVILTQFSFSTAGWPHFGLWLAICACLTVLPACMLALALRLAGGMAEAVRLEKPPRDALCESCGYNLHATGFDQRCPECGKPAAPSFSTIHRVNAWEVRERGFIRSAGHVLIDPSSFFRTIRVHSLAGRARRFLWLSAVSSAVLMGLATIGVSLLRDRALHWNLNADRWFHAVCLCVLVGGGWAIGVTVLSMVAASAMGSASRRKKDYLGGHGAMKIACYLSALSIPWAVVVGGLAAGTFYARALGYAAASLEMRYVLVWAIVGIGLLVWYWLFGSRAYEACQYANT